MNFLNKKTLIILSICMLYLCQSAFAAFDIDTSVDSEIRKKYNTNKIEEDLLPPLPDKLKNDIPLKSNEDFTKPLTPQTVSKQSPVTQNFGMKEVKNNQTAVSKSKGQHIKLRRGTKFTVRLTSGISDKMAEGTKIYFRLAKPITTKYFSLPENTRFAGVVVNSHTPQMSGNGGLLVIKVDNVIVNGRTQEINAKVTKVNYKKVFFNNIKGKRTYCKNVAKSVQPGKRFYNKMWTKSKRLANDSVTVIFSPVTFAAGAVVMCANAVGSPVFAMFSKGGSVSIPANSPFELKLLEDAIIYN